MKEHIVIGVPTCRRPKMLARCLASLAAQHGIEAYDVTVVVACNGTSAQHYEVAAIADRHNADFLYDPVQGIARARNAVLDAATRRNADWIAFIDDDETAEPDWLANLMAPEWRTCPVLMGVNIYQYPQPAPFWAVDKGAGRPSHDYDDEGLFCRTASAGNVRFSMELVRAGLRFDESIRLGGGEDNDFFSRAWQFGFSIRRTCRAVTRETVHPERTTYRYQIYRCYWCAASDMGRLAIHKGWTQAVLHKSVSLPMNVLFGLFWLAASLPAAPFSLRCFKTFALRGGKSIAKSAGRLAAMLGVTPQPYRTIHGE